MKPRIILEGPDGSGKSTLATILSNSLGLSITPGGGPEKHPGEINERVRSYLADHVSGQSIYDRHPCISNEIYRIYTGASPVDKELLETFYSLPSLIIFCQGFADKLIHQENHHDTPEHLRVLAESHADICYDYEEWAVHRAHIIYNYRRTPPGLLLRMIKGVFDQ